jgi:hypothetical protein
VRPGKPAVLGHKTQFLLDAGKANVITAVEVRPAGRLTGRRSAEPSTSISEQVGDRGYGQSGRSAVRIDVSGVIP